MIAARKDLATIMLISSLPLAPFLDELLFSQLPHMDSSLALKTLLFMTHDCTRGTVIFWFGWWLFASTLTA